MSESADPFVFGSEKVFQFKVQGVAEGGQVKKVVSQFFGDNFPAVFTHFSFDVRVHEFATFFKRFEIGILFFYRLNRDTAAIGNCFNNAAVDPGI